MEDRRFEQARREYLLYRRRKFICGVAVLFLLPVMVIGVAETVQMLGRKEEDVLIALLPVCFYIGVAVYFFYARHREKTAKRAMTPQARQEKEEPPLRPQAATVKPREAQLKTPARSPAVPRDDVITVSLFYKDYGRDVSYEEVRISRLASSSAWRYAVESPEGAGGGRVPEECMANGEPDPDVLLIWLAERYPFMRALNEKLRAGSEETEPEPPPF